MEKAGINALLHRVRETCKEKGVFYIVYAGITRLFWHSCYKIKYRGQSSPGKFTFRGNAYSYFSHAYNRTWTNERVLEVPIIWDIVREHQGKKILEVGNVLSHYFSVAHDILDKYESAPGVINQDVVEFRPAVKYDLIVSISTLEHVGWDECPRDPAKTKMAVENLKRCLVPGGKIAVTLALGLNCWMDQLLREGEMQFTEQHFFKRISMDNKWTQVDQSEVQKARYGHPFPGANEVAIGLIEA